MNSLVVWYIGLNTDTGILSFLCCQILWVVFWKGHVQLREHSAVSMPVTLLAREAGGQPPIPGIRQLQGPCWGQVVMPAWVKVVAVHRQSWGCMWGCNWNKGQWDSLHLNTAPRGRRARPLRGLSFLQGYQPLLLPSQPWAATLPGGRRMCAVHLQCWPAASEVGIAYLSIKRWNEIIT